MRYNLIMKIITTLILAAFTLFITGCDRPETDKQGRHVFKPNKYTGLGTFKYIIFDGHEYVMFSNYNQGGICHSPKCSCRR